MSQPTITVYTLLAQLNSCPSAEVQEALGEIRGEMEAVKVARRAMCVEMDMGSEEFHALVVSTKEKWDSLFYRLFILQSAPNKKNP